MHAKQGAAFGGGTLNGRPVASHDRLEIVRAERGLVRAKGRVALPGSEQAVSTLWTEEEMSVVANPRAGLMRGANALYLTRRGLVKAVALLGLRSPVGHGKGTGYQRQRIALRKSVHRFGPLGGVGIVEEGSVGHRLGFFLQMVFCVVSPKSNKIRGEGKERSPARDGLWMGRYNGYILV